ncbi:hypothetical protein [Lentzea xinjiangensis]|uniref:hypothetical protein n=1 Tax=Lentzea xinjiangensis TaxID=402600 RepID=UPI0011605A1B|nr:hypothetical protein [Lentzea xinjiangensis]
MQAAGDHIAPLVGDQLAPRASQPVPLPPSEVVPPRRYGAGRTALLRGRPPTSGWSRGPRQPQASISRCLVRTHHTAAELRKALKLKERGGQWDVVAQIVLQLHDDLSSEHREALHELRMASTWATTLSSDDSPLLEEVVRRHGVSALYHRCNYHNWFLSSVAEKRLRLVKDISRVADDRLAVAMTEQDTPWFSEPTFPGSDLLPAMPDLSSGITALRLVLSLPYFELEGLPRNKVRSDPCFPEPVRMYVNAWRNREISVPSQGQPLPPPPRAPR